MRFNLKYLVLKKCAVWTVGVLMLACGALADERPWVVVNEDNDHFFKLDSRLMTRKGLEDYIDSLCVGAVTHVFFCPCGQRTSYGSGVWEPIWAGVNEPDFNGRTNNVWCVNAKRLFDAGIDPYAVWIARCRTKGVSPWLTMRMNDAHYAHIRGFFRNTTFWRTHPELYRVPKGPRKDWASWAFDYAHREVRDYHLAMVRELIERFDADGLELDWNRCGFVLREGEEAMNARFVTEVVREARRLADAKAAKTGRPYSLGVRVPSRPDRALAAGYDVAGWLREGLVDLIVPCNNYFCADFALPVREWNLLAAGSPRRVRVIPGTDQGVACVAGSRRGMDLGFYRGWAEAMYASGAQGVYLFNAVYLPVPERDALLADPMLRGGDVSGRPRRFPAGYCDFSAEGLHTLKDPQLPQEISDGAHLKIFLPKTVAAKTVAVVLKTEDAAEAPADVRLNGAVGTPVRPGVWRFSPEALRGGENVVAVGPRAGAQGRLVWGEIALDSDFETKGENGI